MAYEGYQHKWSLPAGSDLSAKQYYCGKVSSGVLALAGAGEDCDGIIQNKPIAAEPGELCNFGVTKVIAGAAISVDANLTPDTNGKAVTATTGDVIFGKALEAATAANQLISVMFYKNGISA